MGKEDDKMKQEISPVGSKIGEVYFPPKSGENGKTVAFIWDGDAFRFARPQEILAAQQAEAEKHPLVNRLPKREVRQLKVLYGSRYLGQPRIRY